MLRLPSPLRCLCLNTSLALFSITHAGTSTIYKSLKNAQFSSAFYSCFSLIIQRITTTPTPLTAAIEKQPNHLHQWQEDRDEEVTQNDVIHKCPHKGRQDPPENREYGVEHNRIDGGEDEVVAEYAAVNCVGAREGGREGGRKKETGEG